MQQVDAREFDQRKRKFREFLNDNNEHYMGKIRDAIDNDKFRFTVNINDIRNREADWAQNIVSNPREYLLALTEAAQDAVKGNLRYEKALGTRKLQAGFEGSLGANSVSPRGLSSRLINSLVEVEGFVTKCSSVRPKLMKSVQYCPNTGKYTTREYRDSTSMDVGIETKEGQANMPTGSAIPTIDNDKNALEMEYGLCEYKNYQTITLTEMPEKAPVGQLPRSVEVILEHDLVDHAKPGDRVMCVGVYRSKPSTVNGATNGVFPTVLMCNQIRIIGTEIGAVKLTESDVKNIRELSDRADVLDIMSRSLCPSIFGHENIKKALVLQLLGGCEKVLENKTHLRGDINIMMVGDPSTAKSQLLRSILEVAPLAVSTTGRGSSGVGLTAAVTSDPETGERRLEAGAMVRADRGTVCIDEFDKMAEADRVAIHEVMEQQTVTIAKAGIHVSLNARCSVLAAANPVYGQYDTTRRPQENIGLPDSLLSRFDLLFIVLDTLDPVLDRTLSSHVMKSHQYRRPGTIAEPEPLNQRTSLNLDEGTNANGVEEDTPVWQRGGRLAGMTVRGDGRAGDVLSKEFFRKYIHYAKTRVKPELSEEAMQAIPGHYSAMRSKNTAKNLPITARTLETIIRLSSASAKSRLSASVDVVDVDQAMELMNFVLFAEVGTTAAEAAAMAAAGSGGGGGGDDGGDGGDEGGGGGGGGDRGGFQKKKQGDDDYDASQSQQNDNSSNNNNNEVGRVNVDYSQVDPSEDRVITVMNLINRIKGAGMDEVDGQDLITQLNSSGQRFEQEELVAILNNLETQNKIMFNDGVVYFM